MIRIPSDFKEFLRLLNSRSVEYMLIGCYAVGFHGYPRPTGDMDIWISRSSENAARVVRALVDFGFEPSQASAALFTQPDQIIRMGMPPLRLVILTSVSGLDFGLCYPRRIVAEIDSVAISIISREDLRINKRASGRYKDLDDLEQLT